jgi:hypothetical protein
MLPIAVYLAHCLCVFARSVPQIVGTHFAQLKCSQAADNVFVKCGSGAHIIASAFAMVLLLCFVLVTFTLSSTFYARLPIAAAILSRPDARGHTLTLLFKLILVGIYSFLSSASYQWVTIVITLVLMLLLSTYHARALPYYRHSWNTVHCCFLYGVLWCCFSVVLIQLVDSPLQTGVSLMFLLAFPVALLAGSLNVRVRTLVA